MRTSSHSSNARDRPVLSSWNIPSSLNSSNALRKGVGIFVISFSQNRKLRNWVAKWFAQIVASKSQRGSSLGSLSPRSYCITTGLTSVPQPPSILLKLPSLGVSRVGAINHLEQTRKQWIGKIKLNSQWGMDQRPDKTWTPNTPAGPWPKGTYVDP